MRRLPKMKLGSFVKLKDTLLNVRLCGTASVLYDPEIYIEFRLKRK